LFSNISSSRTILTAIDRLARVTHDGEEPSDDDDDSDEGEIVALARKTLNLLSNNKQYANNSEF
jgi:hypothetical protein